jgi:hypothetical protein
MENDDSDSLNEISGSYADEDAWRTSSEEEDGGELPHHGEPEDGQEEVAAWPQAVNDDYSAEDIGDAMLGGSASLFGPPAEFLVTPEPPVAIPKVGPVLEGNQAIGHSAVPCKQKLSLYPLRPAQDPFAELLAAAQSPTMRPGKVAMNIHRNRLCVVTTVETPTRGQHAVVQYIDEPGRRNTSIRRSILRPAALCWSRAA